MANMIQLGRKPDALRVLLTTGGSFRSQIDLNDTDEDFAGIEPILVFEDGTEWTAVLSELDKVATWDKTAVQVAALLASLKKLRKVSLLYDGAYWAKGLVEVL